MICPATLGIVAVSAATFFTDEGTPETAIIGEFKSGTEISQPGPGGTALYLVLHGRDGAYCFWFSANQEQVPPDLGDGYTYVQVDTVDPGDDAIDVAQRFVDIATPLNHWTLVPGGDGYVTVTDKKNAARPNAQDFGVTTSGFNTTVEGSDPH